MLDLEKEAKVRLAMSSYQMVLDLFTHAAAAIPTCNHLESIRESRSAISAIAGKGSVTVLPDFVPGGRRPGDDPEEAPQHLRRPE